MSVRYEDLCANPIDTCREAAAFCELEWTDQFEKYIAQYSISDANDKWQKELTSEQQESITDIMEEYLLDYQYLAREEALFEL
ncbi:sulfotransferase [Chloroflexi bacterium TSY]|nr:sulfotransferase [Chloroflexi bacterium TSY]